MIFFCFISLDKTLNFAYKILATAKFLRILEVKLYKGKTHQNYYSNYLFTLYFKDIIYCIEQTTNNKIYLKIVFMCIIDKHSYTICSERWTQARHYS